MPDESCRRCGGMLLDLLVCGKCKATTQFICRICAHKTVLRSHEQICFRIDETHEPKLKLDMLEAIPQNKINS